jgi:uncharacterized membrane protein YkvI
MKLIDKKNMSVTIGVAFVWFTTQFGGGFASGAQLFQYFIVFGIWTLITPILAQALSAVYQWYALRYAHRHQVYDYRSFNDSFYGKFAPVFSNLYEVVYFILLCLAPSVAFATGGATLAALTGIPFIVCTFIIGIFIFLITIYGTEIVRKAAATLSVVIIVGLMIVYIPNIIVQWDTIMATIGELAAEKAPMGPAMWKSFIYFSFQLASIGLLVQHAKPFTSEKDAKTSMIYGFIVNAGVISISTLGMLAIAKNPEVGKVSIPILLLVKNGVGSSFMTPIISMLIVLGAVSTAVNMIAGVVNRVTSQYEKPVTANNTGKIKPSKLTIITTLLFVILAFGIAQFGLIPLVVKGYGYLGYVTIAVVVIPFTIHMILSKLGKVDSKKASKIA